MDCGIWGCALHCSLAFHNMKSGPILQCDPCMHRCFLSAVDWEIGCLLEHPARKRENGEEIRQPAVQPPSPRKRDDGKKGTHGNGKTRCCSDIQTENEKTGKRENGIPVLFNILPENEKTRKRENEKTRKWCTV